ncbi:Y-family DNA polymerase [uncultured Vagococcus sp.]|uniref:Y-family DNA polymerase n=1 Tax=uncultured Vagococcus sp. TaxID=189676 RepID=UPI0028D4D710|nr:Y-family DNA polymerase [uncultured Vagococcus sp.]
MEYDYSNEPHRDILCVDLKSFYASVECVSRGLDPLKTLLIVMSNADSGGGLALAASPMAKSELGITNVTRKYEIPDDPRLLIVPPRMKFYLDENMKINEIFRRYVSDTDLHIYSVDESFLDVTASLKLFNSDAYGIARMIQFDVYHELGLYCTIGIGDNPLLAKLALDNSAKKSPDMKAEWRYKDVPNTIWKIPELTDMWGIGGRTKKRLNRYGITSVYELAQTHPALMKERLGVMGEQLIAHAWGIDRSRLNQVFIPAEKSYGNSQVLMRDYNDKKEIEIVIREIAEQVATRIRRQGCQTECVSLGIGYSRDDGQRGFSRQKKITATANSKILTQHCLDIFRENYENYTVRHISISYSKLVHHTNTQLDLFQDPVKQISKENVDNVVDIVRSKFGFRSLVHSSSLLDGATAINRSSLVGGHAGGTDGID